MLSLYVDIESNNCTVKQFWPCVNIMAFPYTDLDGYNVNRLWNLREPLSYTWVIVDENLVW